MHIKQPQGISQHSSANWKIRTSDTCPLNPLNSFLHGFLALRSSFFLFSNFVPNHIAVATAAIGKWFRGALLCSIGMCVDTYSMLVCCTARLWILKALLFIILFISHSICIWFLITVFSRVGWLLCFCFCFVSLLPLNCGPCMGIFYPPQNWCGV